MASVAGIIRYISLVTGLATGVNRIGVWKDGSLGQVGKMFLSEGRGLPQRLGGYRGAGKNRGNAFNGFPPGQDLFLGVLLYLMAIGFLILFLHGFTRLEERLYPK